jgi:hypothetical protein
MDPKSKLYHLELPVTEVLGTMLEWFMKDKRYYWGKTPDEIMTTIHNWPWTNIKYRYAVEILNTARTNKLPGGANAGMSWMKQEWKRKAKEYDRSETRES